MNPTNQELLDRIVALEAANAGLRATVDALGGKFEDSLIASNKNNFSDIELFNKRVFFNSEVRLTLFDTLPTKATIGDICQVGGLFYLCTAADTWTLVGPKNSFTNATLTDPSITGGTITDTALIGDALNPTIVSASDNAKYIAGTIRSENNDAYTREKEIQVRYGGVVRVSFDLATAQVGGTTSFARIYVNDVAVGTERQANSDGNWYTYTEDISIKPFDKIELYAKDTSGDASQQAKVRNFTISWDRAQSSTTGVVIQN